MFIHNSDEMSIPNDADDKFHTLQDQILSRFGLKTNTSESQLHLKEGI